MNGWGLLMDVLGAVGGALVLLVVVWAACERGRVHRRVLGLPHEPERPDSRKVIDWCMAMGAMVGAV